MFKVWDDCFCIIIDQAGPITLTVEDSSLMLQSMVSWIQRIQPVQKKIPNFQDFKNYDCKGKSWYSKRVQLRWINQEIKKIWDHGINWLKSAGAEIIEVSLPNTESALLTYYIQPLQRHQPI